MEEGVHNMGIRGGVEEHVRRGLAGDLVI